MIFDCPVTYGIHNIFPYHVSLGCCIISTSWAVWIRTVFIDTGKISRNKFIDTEIICTHNMIVYHITITRLFTVLKSGASLPITINIKTSSKTGFTPVCYSFDDYNIFLCHCNQLSDKWQVRIKAFISKCKWKSFPPFSLLTFAYNNFDSLLCSISCNDIYVAFSLSSGCNNSLGVHFCNFGIRRIITNLLSLWSKCFRFVLLNKRNYKFLFFPNRQTIRCFWNLNRFYICIFCSIRCIVNAMYVTSIRRCEVELIFKIRIPIPVPSYTTVKKELNARIMYKK